MVLKASLVTLASAAILAGCGHSAKATDTISIAARQAPTGVAAATLARTAATPSPAPTTATVPPPAPSTVAVPTTPAPEQLAALRPPIYSWPIPFDAARKREMAAYSLRHYGEDTYRLSTPRVIVEHYTETSTAQQAYNTFAPDVPDNEFHELPNTCAHFLVEQSGRIDQLVALGLRCRHTTGLNWTAIGIENVGLSDQAILANSAQLRASLRLTRWLRCRYGVALRNVIGHNESLSSPYHHDRVPAFQHQTHSDWNHADMNHYRALLARLPCPG